MSWAVAISAEPGVSSDSACLGGDAGTAASFSSGSWLSADSLDHTSEKIGIIRKP
jgi:hypothetical protein